MAAPTLTIGGEVRELRLTATDCDQAERQILKHGGRPLLAVLGASGGIFTKFELEWLVWAAWRRTLSADRIQTLLAQYYAEDGTLFELQTVIVEALIDSGLFGRRKVDEVDRADPPVARASGA